MKIVVAGGTGLVGARIVDRLRAADQVVVAASRRMGVDTVTGAGLAKALDGASVVVDATNAPRPLDPEEFFGASTRRLLAACAVAKVRHVVLVSIVGVDRLDGPHCRGKQLQERLVAQSGIPYTIARATQFTEFVSAIADAATVDGVIRLPPIFIQPIPVEEAAAAIARIALEDPLNGVTDIAGPARFVLPDLVARKLATAGDPRRVIPDPQARYFGADVNEGSLIPQSPRG